jgi:hypothetical protein
VTAGAAGAVGVAVAGPSLGALLALVMAQAVRQAADVVANVHQWSLRQAVTPDALQSRVTAAHRFLVHGAGAGGALLAGALATAFGTRPALLLCAVAATLAPLPALASPLRRLREQPAASAAQGVDPHPG